MTTLDWKLQQEPDFNVAFVRLEVAPGDAGRAVSEVLDRLRTWASRHGVAASLAYSRYLQWDGDSGSGIVEVGIGVADSLPAEDDIVRGRLQGGLGACTAHDGPLDGLLQTWRTLDQLVKTQGYRIRAPGYEIDTNYFDDPPEGHLRTRVVLPVEATT